MRLASFSASLGLALFVSAASAQTFNFPLSGSQEVPPVATPATGTGSLTLSGGPGAWVATYSVNYSGLLGPIVNPPGAHIHNAPAGANGPVVHFLDGVASWVGTTSGMISGDWRFDDASNPLTNALANELLAGRLYFNIHTQFSTPGELRGQIVPEPAAFSILALGLAMVVRRRK